MEWWIWVMALIIIAGMYSFATRNRDVRVRAVIRISVNAFPTVQIDPSSASTEDLLYLVLCYASKVRWLLLSEPPVIQDMFREICAEAISHWDERGSDLIDRMPTARALRSDTTGPKAVSGGETYKVSLRRTGYKNLENRAWVINSLPKASLAVNPPLTAIVLLNVVFALLSWENRQFLRSAWTNWFDLAFGTESVDQSTGALRMLFKASADSITEARNALETNSA
jgi:hypothetical protein